MLSIPLLAVITCCLAQALLACVIPSFYFNNQITAVGGPLFLGVEPLPGSDLCNTSAIIGNVWLYRPKDPTFLPKNIGYFNSYTINASEPNNEFFPAPPVAEYGYGYQVSIVPDRSSPVQEVQTSPAFALVTLDWYNTAHNEILLYEPSYEDTQWSKKDQELISWNTDIYSRPIPSLDFLLYQSEDLSWGPLTLASNIPAGNGYMSYSYNDTNHLPLGQGYFLVIVDHSVGKAGVLAISGSIEIV